MPSFKITLFFSIAAVAALQGSGTTELPSFESIAQKSAKIPTFRELHKKNKVAVGPQAHGILKNKAYYKQLAFLSLSEFEAIIDRYFEVMTNLLGKKDQWLHKNVPFKALLDVNDDTFVPYAEKLTLPAGALCLCKGDLHGAGHSLVAFFKDMAVQGYTDKKDPLSIKNDAHFAFLGDYVDRGLWGVECIALLMLFKIKNPHNVHLVRGNHEDPWVCDHFGFGDEFENKFAQSLQKDRDRVYAKLTKFYTFLPLVLYVGSGTPDHKHFFQCCHAGVEIGYNPKTFLNISDHHYDYIDTFKRETNCTCLPKCLVDYQDSSLPLSSFCKDFKAVSPSSPDLIGFCWSDFVIDPKASCRYQMGRGMAFNKTMTEAVLEAASSERATLSGIIRAHQHSPHNYDPLMQAMLKHKGAAVLWKQQKAPLTKLSAGSVITLLLSCDSLFGTPYAVDSNFAGFNFDTCLVIKTAEKLDNWEATVLNNYVYGDK